MAETVLVVEDDEDIMDILSAYLRKHGFSVLSAVNGKEAMRLYGQGGIDLMLTDIVLPDMEGTELAERIRKGIATMPILSGNVRLRITSSVGLAVWDRKESAEDFFRRADQQLYQAKKHGRNRVSA